MKFSVQEELVKVIMTEVTQTWKDKHSLFPYIWILGIKLLNKQVVIHITMEVGYRIRVRVGGNLTSKGKENR